MAKSDVTSLQTMVFQAPWVSNRYVRTLTSNIITLTDQFISNPGLVGGSAGLGGGLTSLIVRSLISHFNSTRKALAILAGMWSCVWAAAWFLIKENRETPDLSPLWHRDAKGERGRIKIAKRPGLGDLMHDGVFWSLMLCIFLSCL